MAINAVILDVKRNRDGTAELKLGPHKGDGPGQPRLIVINPPPLLEEAIGVAITGDDSFIYVAKKVWAERSNYTRIKLVPRN